MRKLLSAIFILVCLCTTIGCANNKITTLKHNKETITINHEDDNIKTVVFSTDYPTDESIYNNDNIGQVAEEYKRNLEQDYGEGSVLNATASVKNSIITLVTEIDFEKVKDLTKFGINSSYPSYKEFVSYLNKNGFK
jgi:lipoprotein